MECAAPYLTFKKPKIPESVEMRSIDLETKQGFTRYCPKNSLVKEYFLSGTEPIENCHLHAKNQDRSELNTQNSNPNWSKKRGERKKNLIERLFSDLL